MHTLVFYIATAVVSRPKINLHIQAFDTVQEACKAAAKDGEDIIARVQTLAGATSLECCKDTYRGTDLVDDCFHDPDTWSCKVPSYSVTSMKCISEPSFKAVDILVDKP